jgi:hypothetical protein
MNKILLTHSLSTKDGSNVLVVGSCRTGKTDFFIKPNLFSLKDSVIVISKDSDKLFEETASYRKDKFKQKIFTEKDFINRENLDFMGDNFTLYLTGSAIDEDDRIDLMMKGFNWISENLYQNPPKKPITIIIDDLLLFPIAENDDNLLHKTKNIRIVATVQSMDHIKINYRRYNDILKLFEIKMFFHVNNLSDAEYIKDLYCPEISIEEILQLKSNECLIFGFFKSDDVILANDKINHWFRYGKTKDRCSLPRFL